MEIKIYADRCLTCQENRRLETIMFIGKKHGLKTIMRRVYALPELKKEADEYGVPMPFIALGDKTLDFFAVGEYMLKDDVLEDFINE